MATRPSSRFVIHRSRLLAVAIASCFAGGAHALPVAPSVVNGAASFAQSGNVLTVTNSNGAIINWQSFNIGAGETTRFIQPSASSQVMNRVLANDPSLIYGNLSSNGKVWLVNPAGILVGPSGSINTAGFVASTLPVRNEDFLANKLSFGNGSTLGSGTVVNQGTITTPEGGSVYLIGAASVENQGLIQTPKGETVLAAGQTVQLLDTGTPGVKVEITGNGNSTNLGQIVADAGRIGLVGSVVKNRGTLNASSVVNEGGRIFLRASQDAYVDGDGRIVTTGSKGGQVEVLGNRVAVMDNAAIDASGSNGGGTLLVGGDYQGKNPDIPNSQITYFGPNASLKANATDNGNGGKVIVWADDTTRAYGRIEAKGGASGGNGGFVETSGHKYLDFHASVDTQAPKGTTGTLLLDPEEIQVYAGAGTDAFGFYGAGGYGGANWFFDLAGNTQSFTAYGSGSTLTSVVYGDNIGYLLQTSNVTLMTAGLSYGSGNITFNSGAYNWSGTNLFSLLAYGGTAGGGHYGNISFNGAAISTAGGLLAMAGWDGGSTGIPVPGVGTITMDSTSSLHAASIGMVAGQAINISSALTASGAGGIGMKAYGDIQIGSSITTGGSDVLLAAGYGGTAGAVLMNGQIVTHGGSVMLQGKTGVTLGDGTANSGKINARIDPSTTGAETGTGGGRVLIDAGTSNFVMSANSAITTSNTSHVLDANADISPTGGVAIGIMAGDVVINSAATIKLVYGGGDIGFVPTSTGTIGLGNYSGGSFRLDNTELSRIILPHAGASHCDSGQEGCRLWIGNLNGSLTYPVTGGSVPVTTQNIVVDGADFTSNAGTVVPKRLMLATAGTINDAGTGAVGASGYYGAKAGHISFIGETSVGQDNGDGVSFIADSVTLNSTNGSVTATSVGAGDLALRRVVAGGNADIHVGGGKVYLLPYFAAQREQAQGFFHLSAQGDVQFAQSGASYTLNSVFGSTFTEAPPATSSILAYGGIVLESQGTLSVVGTVASYGGMSLAAYGGDLVFSGVNGGTMVTDSGSGLSMYGANISVIASPGNHVNVGSIGPQTITTPGTLKLQGAASGSYGAATIYSSGMMGVSAGQVSLYGGAAGNGNYAELGSMGGQSISATSIALYGGATGYENFAAISNRSGNQSISASSIFLRAGGAGANDYNNWANIENFDVNTGSQTVVITGNNGSIVAYGGAGGQGVSSASPYSSYDYSCPAAFSSACYGSYNAAEIRNVSYGGQTVYFAGSGGSINLFGGSDGFENKAGIRLETPTYGGTIGGTSHIYGGPNITLTGGSGGKVLHDATSNKFYDFRNSASLDSGGTLFVEAGTITLNGGSGGLSGAFLGAGSDAGGGTVTVTSAGGITLNGGSGGQVTALNDNASYDLGTVAGIGSDKSVVVSVTTSSGNIALNGGSGASSGALIGSLNETGTVTLNSAGSITATGNASGIMVGSWHGATPGSVALTSGTGNISFDGVSAVRGAFVTANSGQALTLLALKTHDLSAAAAGSISISEIGSSTTYPDLTVSQLSSGNGGVSLTTGTRGIMLSGGVTAAGPIRISAAGSMAQSLSGSISTPGAITLSSGGSISASLGISGASLSSTSVNGAIFSDANVGSFSASNSVNGDIALYNTGTTNLLNVGTVNNVGGNVYLFNAGSTAVSGAISAQGNIYVSAQGSVAVNSGASIAGLGNVFLSAGSSSPSSTTANDSLVVNGTVSSTQGSIDLWGAGDTDIGSMARIYAPAGSVAAWSYYGGLMVDAGAIVSAADLVGLYAGEAYLPSNLLYYPTATSASTTLSASSTTVSSATPNTAVSSVTSATATTTSSGGLATLAVNGNLTSTGADIDLVSESGLTVGSSAVLNARSGSIALTSVSSIPVISPLAILSAPSITNNGAPYTPINGSVAGSESVTSNVVSTIVSATTSEPKEVASETVIPVTTVASTKTATTTSNTVGGASGTFGSSSSSESSEESGSGNGNGKSSTDKSKSQASSSESEKESKQSDKPAKKASCG